MAKVICYLQFEPYRHQWQRPGGTISEAKVVAVTQKKPTDLKGERIAVKLTVDFPLEMFDPPEIPEVTIAVPQPDDMRLVLRAVPDVVLADDPSVYYPEEDPDV